MERNTEEYDTSDFPEDHFVHNTKNKKSIGKNER